MEVGLETALGAPIEYELADGKVYRFAKITLEDWAAFCEWIKTERRAAIAMITDLPPGEKVALYRDANKAVGLDEMMENVTTVGGLRWLIHRSLLAANPNMKIEDSGKLVGDIQRMMAVVELIAEMPEAEDEPEDPQEAQPD
jgi:hypothetical protein